MQRGLTTMRQELIREQFAIERGATLVQLILYSTTPINIHKQQ